MDLISHKFSLTKEQSQVIDWIEKSNANALQLVAGAGSGKTGTLVASASYASRNRYKNKKLGLITFTRKAAGELNERLADKENKVSFAGTMHSLAYHLLKKSGHLPKKLIENELSVKRNILNKLMPQYSHLPAEVLLSSQLMNKSTLDKFNAEYKRYKQNHDKFDFDDLIHLSIEHPPPLAPFDILFVDEFQDTSLSQIAFIQSLKIPRIICVGDDWQSIYRFRGADIQVSLNFNRYFKNADQLFLSKNFRSQKRIVDLGNKIIKKSSSYIPKKLISHLPKGEKNYLWITEKNENESLEQIFCRYIKTQKNLPAQTYLVRTNFIAGMVQRNMRPQDIVMTIHMAKGLEFDNVSIFPVARNIFPHNWGNPDEEIRLLYVAATRAKKNLNFIGWPVRDKNIKNKTDFVKILSGLCKVRTF